MTSARTRTGTGAAGPATLEHAREHRFLVDQERARRVLRDVSGHMTRVVYQADRPVAYARTIYLDTPERRFLQSYATGSALKLRIRQYASAENLVAPPRITSASYLELKRSAGVERSKLRLELSAEEAMSVARCRLHPSLVDRLSREPDLAEVTADLAGGVVAPQVTSWYRRVSLETDGVRLTLDEAIAFCRAAHPCLPGDLAEPSGTITRESHTILEVKLTSAMPDWLAAAVRELTPTTDYSKFRAAMAAAGTRTGNRDGTLPVPVLV